MAVRDPGKPDARRHLKREETENGKNPSLSRRTRPFPAQEVRDIQKILWRRSRKYSGGSRAALRIRG